jgi:hypothetical protein
LGQRQNFCLNEPKIKRIHLVKFGNGGSVLGSRQFLTNLPQKLELDRKMAQKLSSGLKSQSIISSRLL